ncbi:hypothetical protein PIROE2DRAFT_1788 [Piromyces sp. E2]|nr:hypothetical protein PIROE2DRAFT_1788 [Piromyces sp. E2]|eukprot:OUM70109.1 hypothetical protein PIROE2DRAFT_1788 [Piromyces sp. E2]
MDVAYKLYQFEKTLKYFYLRRNPGATETDNQKYLKSQWERLLNNLKGNSGSIIILYVLIELIFYGTHDSGIYNIGQLSNDLVMLAQNLIPYSYCIQDAYNLDASEIWKLALDVLDDNTVYMSK